MRLKEISKKFVAYACVAALAVTSFTVPSVFAADEDETSAPAYVRLDGGEEGGSPMIKKFTLPMTTVRVIDPETGKKVSLKDDKGVEVYKASVNPAGWWYNQMASFLDAMPYPGEYPYLQFTYEGDITLLRVVFEEWTYDEETEKWSAGAQTADPFWFDPEQEVHFLDPDGKPLKEEDLQTKQGETKTIIVDLAKTLDEQGLDYADYAGAMHFHLDVATNDISKMGHTFTNLNKTYTYNGETYIYDDPDMFVIDVKDAILSRELPNGEYPDKEETTTEPVTDENETTGEDVTTEPTTGDNVTTEPSTDESDSKDLILNGDGVDADKDGKIDSSLINKYPGCKADYLYQGWVDLKGIARDDKGKFDEDGTYVDKYRYLIMTYTGDIEFLRFEFVHFKNIKGNLSDINNMEKAVLWFNPNQADHFEPAAGTSIPFDTISNNENTIVIDLMKSKFAGDTFWDWYADGLHVHTGAGTTTEPGFREVLGFNIINARLSASPELKANEKNIAAPTGITKPKTNEEKGIKPPTTTKKPTPPTTKKAPVKAPGKATVKKVNTKKRSAKKIKLTLKKISGAKGYQVGVYKTKSNAKKNKKALVKKIVRKYKNITITSKKLKNKKKLYVAARAYKLDGKSKKYGRWSSPKKVRIKK